MSKFTTSLTYAIEALQDALQQCPAVPAYADTHVELTVQIERLSELLAVEEAIERSANEQA